MHITCPALPVLFVWEITGFGEQLVSGLPVKLERKREKTVYLEQKVKNIDYWPNLISSYWQMYIQGCQQPTLMCLANLKNVWNRLEHILPYNFVAHLIKVAYVKSKNKP